MKRETGLTLAEVIVALAVLGIVIAVLTTSMAISMQQNMVSGGRTQAVQVLNYLGRLVAGGDAGVATGSTVTWEYGELTTAFPELTREGGFADPERYRAAITNLGSLGIGAAVMVHYRVQVCWQAPGGEQCVAGDTAGPAVVPGGGAPELPFVN